MPRSENWTQRLDWNLLKTFMAIAEERSVSKAAARLLLQQPSVSAALKRLEETFGCNLVERDRRPLTLTPQGEIVLAEARGLYASITNLGGKVTASVRGLGGIVRLKVVPDIVDTAFDDVFRTFRQANPAVSFQIETANSNDIVRAVSRQVLPFGICLMTRPVARLRCHFLFRETFGLFAAPDHRLRATPDIDLDSIKEERWVTYTAETLEPMMSLRLGTQLSERVAATTSTPSEIRRLISIGMGIGLLPVASARQDVRDGRLWQLPILDKGELGADLYLVSHPGTAYSATELAFRDEFMAASLPGDGGMV